MATAVETKLTVLNPEGYPPRVDARGMAPALETLQGKRLFLVDVGSRTRTTSSPSCRAGSRSTSPASGRRSCAGGPAPPRPGAVRADRRGGGRGDHRRRHLTGLRAGGLRPHDRHGVGVRDPDRGRPRPRVRPPCRQHRAHERDAAGTAGLRSGADVQPAPGGAARVRRGRRRRPRRAVHAARARPAHHAALERGPERERVGPHDAAAARAGHGGEPAPAVPRQQLDGLPPDVLPTEERVEAMLAGTSRSPDEVVGKHRPTIGMELWESTWRRWP